MIQDTAKFVFLSAIKGARFLLKGMPKKKHIGTVGAFFIRRSAESNFEVLVGKRSKHVAFSQQMFATPGGAVEKGDLVDSNGVLRKDKSHFRALRREVLEETSLDLDEWDQADIWELEPLSGEFSSHKNFVIVVQREIHSAYPDNDHQWE